MTKLSEPMQKLQDKKKEAHAAAAAEAAAAAKERFNQIIKEKKSKETNKDVLDFMLEQQRIAKVEKQ